MKTVRRIDAAKFFCGFETFHTFSHAVLWGTGTEMALPGIHAGQTWHIIGVFLNAAIAIVLAVYAWRGKPIVDRETGRVPAPPRVSPGT